MNIYITKDLHDHLEQKDGISSKDFKRWFLEWKQSKDACSSMEFGKDVTTDVPPCENAVGWSFDKLWHVHLAPNGPIGDIKRWNNKAISETQNIKCNRSSDRLLFYVRHNDNYMLLMISDHAQMTPRTRLRGLCDSAERAVKWMASK